MATLTRTLFALGFTALLAGAGCGGGSSTPSTSSSTSSSSTPVRGGALIASIRSEPATYNRYTPRGGSAATGVVTGLMQAPLVRVNRVTDELEPWLADKWISSPDGLTHTVMLRDGIKFSDGTPLTSADVLFSFQVAYDQSVGSPLASAMMVNGKPLAVSAADAKTIVVRFPAAFAPGLRVLDHLPILPKHKLEGALTAKQFSDAWTPSKPLSDVAGLGPFVLTEHVAGQRLVFARNPHYFRRDASGTQLPYLDRLTLVVVPDQSAEALRLEASEIDLMTNADIRPQDYAGFKRLADENRLKLIDVGVGLDPDFLAFNLKPSSIHERKFTWLARKELRQAISCGVDRQAIVNAVYLGAAEQIYGAVTSANRKWHSSDIPTCKNDRERARKLLAAAGLTDRNGDGTLEDQANKPARFSILTQAGHIRERVATVIQEQLRQLGIAVDIVPLDQGGLFKRWQAGDYDAIYFGLQASSTDPALNPDLWLSSGAFHFWNPGQPTPATPWEKRIDELMREQASASDLAQRQRAFAEVQRILADELPNIYFVVPRVTLATSTRVVNPTATPQIPQLLWSADTLAAAPGR